MKQYRQIAATFLKIAGLICLVAAGVLMFQYRREDRLTEEQLEAYRPGEHIVTDLGSQDAKEDGETSVSEDAVSEDETAEDKEAEDKAVEDIAAEDTVSEDAVSEDTASEENVVRVDNPYKESFLANSDMAAWLTIPGTVIDYPVMWTPEDENYYLYRDFEKNDSTAGSLILDTDSCVEPSTTNLIIHGHNMKAGTMFGSLKNYESQSYGEEHGRMILHTREGQRNYEVLAVFRSQVYRKSDQVFKYYQFFRADSEEEFRYFYDNIKELSMYDTGVEARFGDRFLTLSTCTYHVDNGRFVVVAKEVEPGEQYLPIEDESRQ